MTNLVTKKDLERAYDRHSRNIDAFRTYGERYLIEGSGSDLMALLERPHRKTVPADLVAMCERLVDKSASLLSS